ncbi:GGDEF domain-containing protein [Shewanella sp. PP-Sp27a-2]
MTGLPNENHWYNPAPSTIHLDMTVALIKIDNLSQINAAFGISVGDAILKAFATELKNRFGHHAKIYRFRGASFALEFTSLPLISPKTSRYNYASVFQQTCSLNMNNKLNIISSAESVAVRVIKPHRSKPQSNV